MNLNHVGNDLICIISIQYFFFTDVDEYMMLLFDKTNNYQKLYCVVQSIRKYQRRNFKI